jgi:NitT/TauT family transport system substrate-binding protein
MNRVLMHRRCFASVAALSIAGLGAPALHAQGKPEKTKVLIAVGGKASVQHLPLTIAEHLGYFAAEGLDVDLQDFGGGWKATQAVLDSSADVVAGAFEDTIHLQGRNQFFRAFVLMGRAPQVALGVSNRTLPSYKTVADLRGRRIGIAMAGSSAGMVASMVLARAGVAPQEVTFIETGSVAAAVAAVRASHVDAMCNGEPVMTLLEHKSEVRIISDTRTLKGTQEVFGGNLPAACLFAPADYLQKNPRTVQAVSNAVVHALKWLQTAGPSDLIKAVPDAYLMGDRGLYLASFGKVREAIAPDGLIPDDGVRNALRAMGRVEPSVDTTRIDLTRTFTNEFARRAKDRFHA